MMSDLISLLDLSNNKFVLLTNSDINSIQFSIHSFIHHFVKKQQQIVLILLSENWFHYSAVASKCGINLKNARDNQQLIKVIDAFSYDQFNYDAFIDDITAQLTQLSSNTVVIIDDISTLFSLNVNFVDIYKLYRNLRKYCANDVIVCIGAHLPDDEDDEELNRFVVSLAHECEIWCEIDKFKTGFSSLITGNIKIHHKFDDRLIERHFKLDHRSVKLLPLGSNLV